MNKQKVESILREQGRKKSWLQEQLGMKRSTFYFFMKGERDKLEWFEKKVAECAKVLGVTLKDIM